MTKTYNNILIVLLTALMLAGCSDPWGYETGTWHDVQEGNPGTRVETPERRRLLLLYSAGQNSLSTYLQDDIKDLREGWLPKDNNRENILLIYTHTPKRRGDYSTPSTPYLIRLYSDKDGIPKADTLITYPAGTVSSSARQLNKVLQYVKDKFNVRSYGMIFSSHATGYLPAGFYLEPSAYKYNEAQGRTLSVGNGGIPSPVPYIEPEHDPSLPMTKSIGQDVSGSYSYEMDLKAFAEAIPMKLDYLLFDACLMGGAEVAYQLRGKCGRVGFSQAEVLAEGLDYKTLTKHLLQDKEADPKAVCEDYFNQYIVQSGVYQSATISLIDCDMLEPLADVCRNIFNANREGLANISPSNVQRFYRFGKHWFYDLESIITEAGASGEELDALYSALDECVIYKGHTPEFMSEFKIDTFSGLSMYLPCNGGIELDKYYRTLSWNEATGLVE